jgi:serine/threonine protein kinase/tetratricopeptide (TPR) repeat protein
VASAAKRSEPQEPEAPKLPSFHGTPRFEVRRKLGEGGMGIVYEAFDKKRGELVALKTTTRVDPGSLYLFKQEFRGLAHVAHPNLASLHALLAEDKDYLLSMELVDGVGFLAYVRGEAAGSAYAVSEGPDASAPTQLPSQVLASSSDATMSPEELTAERVSSPPSLEHSGPIALPKVALRLPLNPGRLKQALVGLVAGLEHLHGRGKLHRDIKPSNVMVTPEGRTVLLDFGLVTDVARRGRGPGEIAGTPGYMAPEHLGGRPLGPASDWYAVGVMLYEALTGCLPFPEDGSSWDRSLRFKQMFDPPSPRELAPDADPQLEALCMALLRREPEQRAGGREILHTLGVDPAGILHTPQESRSASDPVRGRKRHVEALHGALAKTAEGRSAVAYVHGTSGLGKSTVVRRFLDECEARGSVVVLEGRCYERESVPYKALDSLVDALSQHLSRLADADVRALLPRYTDALARLFPVLSSVPAIASAPNATRDIADPLEIRRRGAAALRELFARMADHGRVVLSIDDLQWGDRDSALLLAELLAPPDAPAVLLVASYRDDDPGRRSTLDLLPAPGSRDEVLDLPVEPLSHADALALVHEELGATDEKTRALAETIVRESKGNPFFLHEFVRTAQETVGTGAEALPLEGIGTLDDLLAARVAGLPEAARRLLEIVAVAGRPILLSSARRAADLGPENHVALASLRAGNFVSLRMRGQGDDELESFHDRVRETVAKRLASDVSRARHLAVANALEASDEADPEALAELFRGAGEATKSADYAVLAADAATAALAFDRAAKLYRLALDQRGSSHASRATLLAKLGEALANAGRAAEAGEAFDEVAPLVSDDAALDFRRRAGEQFLVSGHVDRGAEILGTVLDAVGLTMPRTPLTALLRMLLLRAWLAVRGLAHRERAEADVPRLLLRQIDLCFAAAIGLAMVDNVRGAYFQSLNLVLSLRSGEPYRLARAIALEIGYRATQGQEGRKAAESMVPRAMELAQRIGNPHAIGLATSTHGMVLYLVGEWRAGHERMAEGQAILRERCAGVESERTNGVLYSLRCLVYMGEVGRVVAELPAHVEEAAERGNLFFATYLRLRYQFLVNLRDDDPAGARAVIESGLTRWSKRGFHIQHYLDVFGQGEIDLYGGDGDGALARLDQRMPFIQRSMLLRVQHLRVEIFFLRGKAALTAAAKRPVGPERERLLGEATKEARKLLRQRLRWAEALGHVILGGVAATRGDGPGAKTTLTRAAEQLDAADMRLHAVATRWARDRVAEPDAGGEADLATMAAQGITAPERWARMLVGTW